MARPLPVSVPVSRDIETLRKHIVVNLNNLSLRIAQQDNRTAAMSMGGNRLTDVPDPSNNLDAVNLRTLRKYLQGISHPHEKESGADYTIVWSTNGTASGTAPPYIVTRKPGKLVVAKAYALNTGASATAVNIWYTAQGTGTPTKILQNDLVLPGSKNGPVSTTAFTLPVGVSVNDVLYAVISTAGGASNYSVELLIEP